MQVAVKGGRFIVCERCVIIMLMINIYLDESGNLGRGGDFFTIAGVVYDNKKGLNRLRRIVKKECLRLSGSSTPLDELKFHDLSFTDRQRILNRLTCRDDHSIHYIVVFTILWRENPSLRYYNKVVKRISSITSWRDY